MHLVELSQGLCRNQEPARSKARPLGEGQEPFPTARWPRGAARTRLGDCCRGVAAVEFAVTVPILFAFLFAALEFGRYNMIQQAANNAAYEAARQCILPGATVANGQTAGLNVLTMACITGGSVTITPNPILNTTTQVTATVTVPVSSNLWTRAVFCTATSTSRSCTMTCDWVDSAR
jgi:Flp pilus assembly protein TadG